MVAPERPFPGGKTVTQAINPATITRIANHLYRFMAGSLAFYCSACTLKSLDHLKEYETGLFWASMY